MLTIVGLFGLVLASRVTGAPRSKISPTLENVEDNYALKENDFYQYEGDIPSGYQLDPDLQNISRCGPNFCEGAVDKRDTFYVCGDSRLGPVILPSCLPLSSIVGDESNYHRFGGLCPGEFLAAWTGANGFYLYPSVGGFANNTFGNPIQGRLTLVPGMLVDRFGGARGYYLSPASSPYTQRAIPPNNLDYDPNNTTQKPYNYHTYKVMNPVVVLAGPITPWFGQPGFGTQFALYKSVQEYLDDGTLVEVEVEQQCDWWDGDDWGWEKWGDDEGTMRLKSGIAELWDPVDEES